MNSYIKKKKKPLIISIYFLVSFFFILTNIFDAKAQNISEMSNMFLLSEFSTPKSRLLLKKKNNFDENNNKNLSPNLNKKIKIKTKENLKLEDNPAMPKIKIDTTKKEKIKFNLQYNSDEVEPLEEDLNVFINELKKYNKKKITIKGFASKREGDSTSKARRLSLTRALFIRSILLENNFKLSNIQVKALGHNAESKKYKDSVFIEVN